MNSNRELEYITEDMNENFDHMPTEKAKAIIKRVKRNKLKLKIAKKTKQRNRKK